MIGAHFFDNYNHFYVILIKSICALRQNLT